MKRIFQLFPILALLCLYNMSGFAQSSMNLDFELTNYNATLPRNWYVSEEGFKNSLDSLEKQHGKYSLKMEMSGARNNNFGVFTGALPVANYAGKNVER